MDSLKPTSTADRAASLLRERILTAPEGDYLGSESAIAAQIGISLPTLRQAARLLEHEQLLVIKPGKGGGYFSRRPDISSAIKSASQYLSSKDLVSDAQFMDTADPIVLKIVEEAARCKVDSLNRELERFVTRERANAKNLLAPEESFKVTAELMTLLGKMAGNTLLELFVRILWNEISVSRTTGTFEGSLEIVRKNYVTRLRVAEAVLEKDQAKAAAAWRVRSEFLRSWPRRGFRLTRRVNMA